MQNPSNPYEVPPQLGSEPKQSDGSDQKTGFQPRAVIAWAAILLAVAVIVGRNQFGEVSNSVTPGMTGAVSVYQAKYIVGTVETAPSTATQMLQSVDTEVGSVSQRLQNIVLVGDLDSTDAAREQLDSLEQVMDDEDAIAKADGRESYVGETDREVHALLRKVYEEGTSHSEAVNALPDQDRQDLKDKMGWLGELALAPKDGDAAARDAVIAPAKGVMAGTLIGGFLGLGAAFLGFIALIALAVFAAKGSLPSRFCAAETDHRLYIETFAIWLIGVFALQIVVGGLAGFLPPQFRMLPMLGVFFGSLLVLLWPKLHGFTWSKIARDIGWTLPKPIWATPFYGISGYVMALPILGLGLLVTLTLAAMVGGAVEPGHPLEPVSGPSHPIAEQLVGTTPFMLLQVFLLGSVAAPVVEETMFRGVFYRYLREATRSRRFWFSVVMSTIVNCFIFAAIHPQGLITIPVLMSLAIAFTISRELLDSVVPAMVMHGISNGVALTLGVTILSA